MLILLQALEQTADWFRRALSVEPVRGNLRLSGYSACGQDGGVQLPREYVEGLFLAKDHNSSEIRCVICRLSYKSVIINLHFSIFSEGVANADLVLLVTTRPTTGNTLAWAVACERDQWGRAIAGMFFYFD